MILEWVQKLKGYNLYKNNSTFISDNFTFPWRET